MDTNFKRLGNINKTAFQRVIDTLDGCVNAQGIKVKFPAWMVMGSKEWDATPEQVKAYAYQAALVTGWTNKSLIAAVCSVYEFVDSHMANFTIELLEDLAKKYPLEVEGKEKEPPKVTLVDGYGSREI
jgi:hypothetical protein